MIQSTFGNWTFDNWQSNCGTKISKLKGVLQRHTAFAKKIEIRINLNLSRSLQQPSYWKPYLWLKDIVNVIRIEMYFPVEKLRELLDEAFLLCENANWLAHTAQSVAKSWGIQRNCLTPPAWLGIVSHVNFPFSVLLLLSSMLNNIIVKKRICWKRFWDVHLQERRLAINEASLSNVNLKCLFQPNDYWEWSLQWSCPKDLTKRWAQLSWIFI